MAPWIAILIAGLVGFIWEGLWGALVGLACGYVLSLLLGGLSFAVAGGLVPRNAKHKTAAYFLENCSEHAEAAFPNLSRPAQLRAIENAIETVFRRSARDNPAGSQRALARASLQQAAVTLQGEAETPTLREFWTKLMAAIEHTMYL